MHAEFLAPQDPSWRTFLGTVPHDFYHLPGYVELCAGMEGSEPTAFLVQEDGAAMLVPLLVRAIPGSVWRDAASPYGYPGPLFRGSPSPEQVEAFLGVFGRSAVERRIVSVFLRLHPILTVPPAPFQRAGTIVDHGETVYIDLAPPLDELDRLTRPSHRAVARRLLAKGFRVEVDGWSRLPDFVQIYQETMWRRGADESYRFGLAYLEQLRDCLGGQVHLGMVLDPAGEAAAGGVFMTSGDLMQFHLAGNATAFLKESPAKLLVMSMRNFGKQSGMRYFHLGGGVGCTDDSLAYFKRGFSKCRSRFRTFRMILLPKIYRELAGDQADPAEIYFPAYRSACSRV